MKKVITIFLCIFLVSCSIIRNNRTSEAVTPLETEGTRKPSENVEDSTRVVYRSAFTEEYLYSRARQLKRKLTKRRSVEPPTEEDMDIPIEEVAEVRRTYSEHNIHEIIRVVDEQGNVVATKRVR